MVDHWATTCEALNLRELRRYTADLTQSYINELFAGISKGSGKILVQTLWGNIGLHFKKVWTLFLCPNSYTTQTVRVRVWKVVAFSL